MLIIRRDQLEALGNDRARRARQALAGQLNADGLDATYDPNTERLDLRDAAGGTARLEFRDRHVALTTGEGRVFGFDFDDRQRLNKVTDPAGFPVVFDHDDLDALVAIHRGRHSTYAFVYDSDDNLIGIRRPDGRETRFTHDTSGRVTSEIAPSGAVTEFEYAHAGLPQRITDPAGRATSYRYDDAGELSAVVAADGSRQEYRFDVETGHLAIEREKRSLATVTVDPQSGAQHIAYRDGVWTRLVIQENRVVEAANEISKIRLAYDAQGQVLTEDTDGHVVQYVRNAVGALVAIVGPDGERIEFERDAEHRVRLVRDWSGAEYDISYELSGALAGIKYPNGTTVSRASTPIGLPEHLRLETPGDRGVPAIERHWTYDLCDRVASESDGAERREYGYDADGRLVEIRSSSGPTEALELDAVGNRLKDGAEACEYDSLHQLLRRGTEAYRYDAQGNMLEGASPSGAIRCVYDGRGQLVEVTGRSGVTRYAYDPLGRRVRKEHGGRTTKYVWAGVQLLTEITEGDGRTTRRDYLVFPELGTPLGMRVNGEPYYLHHGRRQEPLSMSDSAGRIVWQAEYSAFGQAEPRVSEVGQPFRLVGQYYDEETGLHYNVRRYYDPEVGRFLSMDPLGFAGAGFNLYLHCDGDPLNRIDQTGELAFLATIGIGAALGAVAGAAIEGIHQYRSGKPLDWGKIGKEALIGGVVGAVTGAAVFGLAPLAGVLVKSLAGPLGAGLATAVGEGVLGGAGGAVATCSQSLIKTGQLPDGSQLMWGIGLGAAFAIGLGLLVRGAGALVRAFKEAPVPEPTQGPPVNAEEPLTGEPVHAVTGAVCMWKTDFVLPGALELELKRTYSSELPHSSCFGPRWASIWGQWVEAADGRATFYGGDGRWVKFDLPAGDSAEWVGHPDVAKIRLRRSGTTFEVRDAERRTLRFATPFGERWLLTAIEDLNGRSIRFSYDDRGALRQVEHSGGYRLAVEGSATQIRRVALVNDDNSQVELIRYEYDERGHLTHVIDGSGLPFRYRYDAEARVTRWEDRKGTWYEYEYDAKGRCRRSPGPGGMYDYRFAYDEINRTNTVTDSTGAVTTFIYNELQQLVMKRDARGFVTQTVWDRQSNKLSERDEAGRGFTWEYDADGNVTSTHDALGRTTRVEVNAFGLPQVLTDAAGNRWQRTYDERGNLTSTIGPDGATWRYDRDPYGNLMRLVDPAGHAREFGWDARGLLVWSSDSKGNRTTLLRDALGRVVERIEPLGRRTRLSYNSLGKLAETVPPDGNRRRWEYDAEGNLVRRIGADGKTYGYNYGAFDLLREVIKPSGGRLVLDYDTEARLTTVRNELGQVWRYQYNGTGQVVREEDFHRRVQQFDYDASGLCVRRVNGAGEEILFDRDAAGQLVAKRSTEEARYEYDGLGQVRRAVTLGTEVSIERDAYGRILREVQNGHVVESAYDGRGFRVKRATPAQQCEWRWDANGQVAGLAVAGDELLEFVHDAAGRQVERRMNGGLVLRQEFDAVNRLAKQWVGIEAAGALASTLLERDFRYDANGDPVEIRDARWGTSQIDYDADGRIARAGRRDAGEIFTYDAAGNISKAGVFSGPLRQGRGGFAERARHYGKDGRLQRVADTRYEWDADGRMKEKREGGRRWHYLWSPDGQLRSVRGPDHKSWTYQYDAFGRRVAKISEDATTEYVWDGIVIAEEIGNDGAVGWVHEPSGFVPLLKQEGAINYQCVTDNIGTPTELLTGNGDVAWSASTTVWGGVRESLRTMTQCPIRFQGQWLDAESGLHYNFHRYYDPEIGQYLSPDPVGLEGGALTYCYVHNPFSWVDPFGLAGSAPDFVVTPGGAAIPVPKGASGPVPVVNPQGKTTGFAYEGGSGGSGLDSRVTAVRIMDPAPPKGASPGYPEGYVTYQNQGGQGVNPSTGRTVPNSDPTRHIDLRSRQPNTGGGGCQ